MKKKLYLVLNFLKVKYHTKTKEFRINEHIFFLNTDNLYFLPNNIFTRLFKELKKIYKNNYQ